LKSYLQLSDKQVQDLTALLTSFRDTVKPIHEQIRTDQKQLKQEMDKASPDSSVVAQLLVKVKNLRNQIKAKRDGLQPQLLALLSDSQRSQLAALQQALTVEPAAHQAAALGLIEAPQDHSQAAGLKGGRRGRLSF
jgi:Spy/CpxP family protein refolding chaperone